MNLTDIARLRLDNQHVGGGTLKTVKELAAWMGALQAQDALMMKWAVGVRLPGLTEKDVDHALDEGHILRTHVLRPTWHLVSPDDLPWMLSLTAPRILASSNARHRQLGLTEAVIARSNAVIVAALQAADSLPREELSARLEAAGIATADNRLSHLLAIAELEGLICSGRLLDGKHTYALLEKRTPKVEPLANEDALARLARIYFTSHGPATLKDFAWWSGSALGQASRAFEMIQPGFNSETLDGNTYWFPSSARLPESDAQQVHLLPAFDELIISYAGREAILPQGVSKKAISDNGMFRPVVVVDGLVTGLWKRTLKKDQVFIEIELFVQPARDVKTGIEQAAARYAAFLEKELADLSFNQP